LFTNMAFASYPKAGFSSFILIRGPPLTGEGKRGTSREGIS